MSRKLEKTFSDALWNFPLNLSLDIYTVCPEKTEMRFNFSSIGDT